MRGALVWFRNDLRLTDTPALRAALDAGFTPIPIYIHAPDEEGDWAPDLASNTLGWQWVAGTDADAAPYFRVFNPVTRAEKFDPDGHYIARRVPELATLPVPLRFAPWRDPGALQSRAPDCPRQPVVDLAVGRDGALGAYRKLRG